MSTPSVASSFMAWTTVGLGLLICFLFAGVMNGWASMKLLLEEDGVYLFLCPAGEPTCSERSNRLVFLFALGTTTALLASPLGGYLTDNLGPARCALISGALISSGLLLLGISSGSECMMDGFACAVVLLATGGLFDLLNSFPLTFIVPFHHRSLVGSSCNCIYDASSVIFIFLYWSYADAELSRRNIFIGGAILSAVLHTVLAWAWTSGPATVLERTRLMELPEATKNDEMVDDTGEVATPQAKKKSRLSGLQLAQQLQSFEFWFCLCFMFVQIFCANSYLGTVARLRDGYGDAAHHHFFTQTFTTLLPVSVVFLPLINLCLTKGGFQLAFPLLPLLSIVWSATSLVPNLSVQLLAFVVFTNARALLYSTNFTYIAHTFGSRTSATVGSLIFVVSGIVNAFIYPATKYFEERMGSLQGYYVLLVLLCLPTGVGTIFLRRRLLKYPADDCNFMPDDGSDTNTEAGDSSADEDSTDSCLCCGEQE